MNRNIVFAEGEYYHIYNRGVEKRKIFSNISDWKRFQSLIYLCNGTKSLSYKDLGNIFSRGGTSGKYSIDMGNKLIAVGAYVLMPNHFHLIVREIRQGGVTEFMRKLTTGYTMYFNKKYNRVGPLFQGVFKAEHANRDEYLKYLYSYIHLNPAKIIDAEWREHINIQKDNKLFKFVINYEYSSYIDYLDEGRPQGAILSKSDFPDYFESKSDIRDSLTDWLKNEI